MNSSTPLIDELEASYEKKAVYDGHFFRAILTTGIFCRPICPSPPARPENVLFFSTAAAAAEAGFRPCLRCRPESAPDKPSGVGVSRTILQALRLISDGINESKELAYRLNISPRQLRRYFIRDLGAPPVAIIQTKRLLFAKKLIDETHLPMTEVAFSAGYSSIRRFNDAIKQTYGRTPTELRKSRRNNKVDKSADTISLKLFYRSPYNWKKMWQQLSKNIIPGIESIEAKTYQRVVKFGEDFGTITITPHPEDNFLMLNTPRQLSKHLLVITEKVKRLFDLRASSEMIEAHLMADPFLARSIEKHSGLRILGAWDGFETAVQIILKHHNSAEDASQKINRIVKRFGERLPLKHKPSCYTLFPTPNQLLGKNLIDVGLQLTEAAAIQNIARALVNNELNWDITTGLTDSIQQLHDIARIDPSTAQLISMRVRGEQNAFPVETSAVQQLYSQLNTPLPDTHSVEHFSEAWAPWRAYAALFLWAESEKSR